MINPTMPRAVSAATALALLAVSFGAGAQNRGANVSRAAPPASIPTFPTEHIARKGFFYAGGEYVGESGREIMGGQMYVEVWVPTEIRQPYPLVFFHGNGQTGVDWQQTPDGRPGWAYYLLEQGYVVYMVDYPARGRSAYVPGVHGELGIRTAEQLETIWTNVDEKGNFPLQDNHLQWPGEGRVGDPIFDNFIRTQVQFASGQTGLSVAATPQLLDMIGRPVILVTHSQGGSMGWITADRRPNLVRGIVTIEPGGPQIRAVDTANVTYTDRERDAWGVADIPVAYDPPISDPSELDVYLEAEGERPGEVPCYLQREPVHRLANMQHLRVLAISGNGTYHRVFDGCVPKWLNQAGVRTDFVRLEEHGMNGNGHMMMLERNSDDIIRFIDEWIQGNIT